ncbi:lipoxygenase family protein [Cystobacter fuscus]
MTTIKYRGNKPTSIPVPRPSRRKLQAVSLSSRMPEIPISNLLIADHVPPDELSRLKQLVYDAQRKLQRLLPPMREGLPPIDDDPQAALDAAYTRAHRALFGPPRLPAEYTGDIELGRLAVASPYACYLERAPEGGYQWDFRQLGRYERHPGLRSPGARVLFRVDTSRRRLEAVRIDSELGASAPGDSHWPLARKLALCAATTHLTLVRHLEWIHLIAGTAVAIATHNRLPANHPLRRLLCPHIHGTHNSNLLTTKSQLTPGGDFEAIFSFTHRGMCKLLEEARDGFDLLHLDPELDARRRGVLDGGFDIPVLDNRLELFEVMHAHTTRYLDVYYDSDESLRRDAAFLEWVRELDHLLPGGTRALLGATPTLASTARMLATFIYFESVEHESLGTCLWNYQVWTHVQPVRVYQNGQREPVDVYQRLINANFILNVRRTQLMKDFSPLALDPKGAAAMRAFLGDLEALRQRMSPEPHEPWRLRPDILEANINV